MDIKIRWIFILILIYSFQNSALKLKKLILWICGKNIGGALLFSQAKARSAESGSNMALRPWLHQDNLGVADKC